MNRRRETAVPKRSNELAGQLLDITAVAISQHVNSSSTIISHIRPLLFLVHPSHCLQLPGGNISKWSHKLDADILLLGLVVSQAGVNHCREIGNRRACFV